MNKNEAPVALVRSEAFGQQLAETLNGLTSATASLVLEGIGAAARAQTK